jgi:hypothetical protein
MSAKSQSSTAEYSACRNILLAGMFRPNVSQISEYFTAEYSACRNILRIGIQIRSACKLMSASLVFPTRARILRDTIVGQPSFCLLTSPYYLSPFVAQAVGKLSRAVDQTGTHLQVERGGHSGVRLIKVSGTARDKRVLPSKISAQTLGESCSLI